MKTIYHVTRHAARPLVAKFRRSQPEVMPVINEDHAIYDPAPPHEQVPWWMWGGGLLLSIIMTCVVLGVLASSRRWHDTHTRWRQAFNSVRSMPACCV
jgi:hypothetical protein